MSLGLCVLVRIGRILFAFDLLVPAFFVPDRLFCAGLPNRPDVAGCAGFCSFCFFRVSSDTAIAVVLVSTIPLRMTCATLHRHLWPCRNNHRVPQQPHWPQRSPRLLRAFHELSEPAVHVAMLVALFEHMLLCCISILIISYILHLYLQLIE